MASVVSIFVSVLVLVLVSVVECQLAPSIVADGSTLTVKSTGPFIVNSESLQLNRVDVGSVLSSLQASIDGLQTQLTTTVSSVNSNLNTVNTNLDNAVAALNTRIDAADHSSAITLMNTTLNRRIDEANHTAELTEVLRTIATVNISLLSRMANEKAEEEREHDLIQNDTFSVFESISARLEELEDIVYHDENWANLVENGDFETDDGKAANATKFDEYSSRKCGGGFSIVDVSDDAPPGARASNHSLMLDTAGRQGGCTLMEYEIVYRTATDARHTKICPGMYRIRGWVKVSKDFDGIPQIFHHRFYNGGPVVQDWKELDEVAAIELGSWPRYRDQWTLCEFGIRLRAQADRLHLFVGYPFLGTTGSVMVTNIEFSRLGGGVSNC